MTREETIAYINGQVACALAEIESMKAANAERQSQGYSLAYGENAFFEITNKYCISHNAILGMFRDAL